MLSFDLFEIKIEMQRERYYILNRLEGKQPAMCKPSQIVSIKAVNMVNSNGSVTLEPKRLKITVAIGC